MSDARVDNWGGIPIRLDPKIPEGWVGVEHGRQSCFTTAGFAAGRAIHDAIEGAAKRVRRLELEYVERRILEGDDKITVRHGSRQYVYTAPTWQRQPVKWFKVWKARRDYRRKQ